MRNFAVSLLLFLLPVLCHAQNGKTLSGYVKDASSGEVIIGAVVNLVGSSTGAVTNAYGYYSLEVPSSRQSISCSVLGYAADTVEVNLTASLRHDFLLSEASFALAESKVTANSARERLKRPAMGVENITGSLAKMVPVLFGETDIIKVIQMMPGVQAPSEGSTGFSVRGGGVDQNLILMDEAPVYNAGHFMGFFSIFNNDAVKTADLYKGDMSSKYGGRIASLLDVHTVDGNMQEFGGKVSVGLISSKAFVEGPIVPGKASFMVAARRTYIDIFFPLFKALKGDTMYFYDLNAKVNWIAGDNDRLFLSVFSGHDVFGMHNREKVDIDMDVDFANNTQSLRWNHVFSPKIFANFTVLNSKYDYGMYLLYSATDIDFKSNLSSQAVKADFNWFADSHNTVSFGLQGSYFNISPAVLTPRSSGIFSKYEYQHTHAVEPGAYIEDEIRMADWLSIKCGLRLSYFATLGRSVQKYFNADHQLDHEVEFGKGERIKDWWGLEPRFSSSFMISPDFSLKASYNRNRQYIQQAVYSISGSPLDIWFTASPNVKPQISDQISLGAFKNFHSDALETSVELFYRNNQNTIDFKDHPDVLMNDNMEAELRTGRSYAFGVETMMKFNWKKLNGWVSYTWSRARNIIPEINGGRPYDSPRNHEHSISVVATYSISRRLSASADWIFYSGAPTTYPAGEYRIGGAVLPLYSDRNRDHFPDYHRLDCSLTLLGKHPEKRVHGEWNLSVYNVYSRHNAWAIDYSIGSDGTPSSKKYYLFTIIPSLSYTLYF